MNIVASKSLLIASGICTLRKVVVRDIVFTRIFQPITFPKVCICNNADIGSRIYVMLIEFGDIRISNFCL